MKSGKQLDPEARQFIRRLGIVALATVLAAVVASSFALMLMTPELTSAQRMIEYWPLTVCELCILLAYGAVRIWGDS